MARAAAAAYEARSCNRAASSLKPNASHRHCVAGNSAGGGCSAGQRSCRWAGAWRVHAAHRPGISRRRRLHHPCPVVKCLGATTGTFNSSHALDGGPMGQGGGTGARREARHNSNTWVMGCGAGRMRGQVCSLGSARPCPGWRRGSGTGHAPGTSFAGGPAHAAAVGADKPHAFHMAALRRPPWRRWAQSRLGVPAGGQLRRRWGPGRAQPWRGRPRRRRGEQTGPPGLQQRPRGPLQGGGACGRQARLHTAGRPGGEVRLAPRQHARAAPRVPAHQPAACGSQARE